MQSKLVPCVHGLAFALIVLASPCRGGETVLVELGDSWKYQKGSQPPSDPPTAWREQGFDDSDPLLWLEGPSGIGYGDLDDATILTDMQNGYLSLFTRRTFTVDDPSAIGNLLFSVDYDDGFAAYLNGVEIARRSLGAPGEDIPFDRKADPLHEAGVPEVLDVSFALPSLVAGTNTLAIQVHNWDVTSSDLTMRPRLIADSLILVSPIGLSCTPEDFDADGRTDRIALAWTDRAVYDSIRIVRNGLPLGDPLPGDTTSFTDLAPELFGGSYQVIATIGGADCPPLDCAVPLCEAIGLTGVLSLVDGKTIATLSWSPPPGTESIDVLREGAPLLTLGGTETGLIDPDVESIEPEDDTEFTVVFRKGGLSCTASTGILSLCPAPGAQAVQVEGIDRVRLSWGNMVKLWDSFTVLRDGVEIASGLPGDSVEYLDETVVPSLGVTITYTLRPIAPPGRVPPPCDRTAAITPLPLSERPISPPEGGWDYVLDVEAHPGAPQDLYVTERLVPGNLDGLWIRAAGDTWDGSGVGEAAPGGVSVVELPGSGNDPCSDDLKALEIVDPGDPSSIHLGVDAGSADQNLLRSGVTFAARWRLTPNPTEVNQPGPNGDGQTLASSQGLGQIGFFFRNDGSPALSGEGASAGYAICLDSMNGMEFATAPPATFSLLAGTAWRTVWVTVVDPEGDGTYDVRVYLNGSVQALAPPALTISADGLSLPPAVPDLGPGVINSLAIGVPGVQDDGSIQIDFVAWKRGVHVPVATDCPPGNHPPHARLAVEPPSAEVAIVGGTARVTLDGSASDDGDGGAQGLAFHWASVQGPEPADFQDPSAARTEAVFTEPGTYEVELTIDDREPEVNTDSARASILVHPENHAPLARFSVDPVSRTVALEAGAARVGLDGTASSDGDAGLQALSFAWTASGPGPVAFDDPAAASTGAAFSVAGSYLIRLTVNDGGFLDPEGTFALAVEVQPENHSPTARITRDPPGAVQSRQDLARVAVSGADSDDGDGGVQGLSFRWSQVSGPAAVSFDAPEASETTATFTASGTYEIELLVDDGQLLHHEASARASIEVLPSNHAPSARIAISPPEGTVKLLGGTARVEVDGSSSDDGDGGAQGLSFLWTQVSGPLAAAIQSPGEPRTFVDFAAEGVYLLRLTVDDRQPFDDLATADVEVQVLGANNPPHARIDAGTVPGRTMELSGAMSDDGDGGTQTLTYRWRVASGPGAVSFDDVTAATTRATFSAPGSYVIELTVDDGQAQNHIDIATVAITIDQFLGLFRRGNWVPDDNVDLADPIGLLSYLFLGGIDHGCLDSGDADDNGSLDIADPVRILNWLFLGGVEPEPPGTSFCGPDRDPDDLAECLTVCP